jgi:hypothetical protein
LTLEREDRPREHAAATHELASDRQLDGLLVTRQLPAEPVEPDAAVERAKRHLQRRIELEQVPAQALLAAAPLVDEIIAVIDFGNVTRALLEVDAHDGAAEGRAADLCEAGSGEDADMADVELAPGNTLPTLGIIE